MFGNSFWPATLNWLYHVMPVLLQLCQEALLLTFFTLEENAEKLEAEAEPSVELRAGRGD